MRTCCRAKTVYSHISATCWSSQILNIYNWIIKDQSFHLAKRQSNYFKAIIFFVHFVFFDLSATVAAWWIDLGGLSAFLVENWTLQKEQELRLCLLCSAGVRLQQLKVCGPALCREPTGRGKKGKLCVLCLHESGIFTSPNYTCSRF